MRIFILCLQLLIWSLYRFPALELFLSVPRRTVLEVAPLLASVQQNNPFKHFLPGCESAGAATDFLQHRHACGTPSKTLTWYNFSSPAFIDPDSSAQNAHSWEDYAILISPGVIDSSPLENSFLNLGLVKTWNHNHAKNMVLFQASFHMFVTTQSQASFPLQNYLATPLHSCCSAGALGS